MTMARACDANPEGPAIFLTGFHEHEPTLQDEEQARVAVADGFEKQFGRAPDRVGVCRLPYVRQFDGDTGMDIPEEP